MFLNLLNAFSIEEFNKPIRKHDVDKDYDLSILEYDSEEDILEFFKDNVTRYDYANLDYIQKIQFRAQ